MRHCKIWIAVFLLPIIVTLLFSSIIFPASAADIQDESTEQIEESLKISVFYEQGTEQVIKCFDVNDEGYYAIGYRNNTILIFDPKGVFQYGYRFETIGTYGITLKENSIVIYLGRSYIAAEIDSTGKCIGAQKIDFSKDTTNNVLKRTSKQIGNTKYHLERDVGLFDGDYSRLVKTEGNGNRTVLYDATVKGYIVGVLHYVILSLFPIVGVTILIKKIRENPNTD